MPQAQSAWDAPATWIVVGVSTLIGTAMLGGMLLAIAGDTAGQVVIGFGALIGGIFLTIGAVAKGVQVGMRSTRR